MKTYIADVLEQVKSRDPEQPVFLQAVSEVFHSLEPVFEKNPDFRRFNILERIAEPERQLLFRVPWRDDEGNIRVNRGYRVQFNGAIGPYKGGTRFHKSVNLGEIKFLGFEQIFKNSLTGLPIGGGKGGSNFDPVGKSNGEVMRFCQSYMTELYRHIGPNIDVPAGDIGVGKREIGYMFGQYRRIRGSFENGVLTGKDYSYGGSLIRPEATGYGVGYFCQEMLNHEGTTFKGKIVTVSGFGNVAWGVCQKVRELGGKVVTLSGPDGFIFDPNGINTDEKISYMKEMRLSGRDRVKDYADKFGVEFFEGQRPWDIPCDIAIPCATQNEIDIDDAKNMVSNGVKFLCEGSNMPTTEEALSYLRDKEVVIGPAKAANAGGVSVSLLEMTQNSMRLSWTENEVDDKLHSIMVGIHKNAMRAAAAYDMGYDLVSGANIAGFLRVAQAMSAQGDY